MAVHTKGAWIKYVGGGGGGGGWAEGFQIFQKRIS